MQQFGIGTLPILVTTSSAARGLKFPLIGHVINYDLPHTTEFEIHRIAQTGTRVEEKKGEGTVPIPVGPAGKFGRSISFFDPDRQSDRRIAPELVQRLIEVDPSFTLPVEHRDELLSLPLSGRTRSSRFPQGIRRYWKIGLFLQRHKPMM